jgi:hypothetical protein
LRRSPPDVTLGHDNGSFFPTAFIAGTAMHLAIRIAPCALLALFLGIPHGFGQLTVTEVRPSANLMAVPVTVPIRVDFDRSVDPSSVTGDSFSVFGRWSGAASGTFQFSNNNQTVLFQPDRQFSAGEMVTLNLSNGLLAMDATPIRNAGYSMQYWTASQRVSGLQYNELSTMSTGSPSRPYGGIGTDLNGDGWLDITAVNEDSADLRVFMNQADGTGSFQPFATPTYSVGNRASPSEPADFNGDGHADITTANIDDNTISVLLGNGDGSFAPQQTITVGTTPRGIAVLDVDGDGDPDIVNTNRSSGNLSLHINDGNGVFGTPTTLNATMTGEWSLMASDMNNDGIVDLVVGSGTVARMQVLTGNGDGTFTPQPFQSSGGRSWQIALGDVNGDGNVDVASANAQNNNGSILLGNGDGTFQPPVIYDVASMGSGSNGFPLASDLGDLDGDGDLDWITSSFNGDYIVQLNDGDGNFTFFAELDAPTAASCSLMFDFDNDGTLDLALFDELANSLTLSRNDGHHVLDGDFDANGNLDLVDIDALVLEISQAAYEPLFDLTGDGLLDLDDLDRWLALGGAENLPSGSPYLIGDANLDGAVDGLDFIAWNEAKFTETAAWSVGDFDADGFVDGLDFILWNEFKFMSADVTGVPEPGLAPVVLLGWLWIVGITRRGS